MQFGSEHVPLTKPPPPQAAKEARAAHDWFESVFGWTSNVRPDEVKKLRWRQSVEESPLHGFEDTILMKRFALALALVTFGESWGRQRFDNLWRSQICGRLQVQWVAWRGQWRIEVGDSFCVKT